ncbi:MAG: hypothetical protein JJU20_13605 [Opitutales bacterium]|nr:hypothetical protein [Opitutales bacterium]
MSQLNSKGIFLCALALAVASGVAALGHQLLWTRRLIDLLGASTESTVRVFAAFFLGLALGSALGAWLAQRSRRPWMTLGWAELACAVCTLPIVFLPLWSQPIWQSLGPEALAGLPGSLVKLLLPLLLVSPPALFMGLFLPLIAKALLSGTRRLGREGLWIYGLNTLGGMLGLWIVAVITLPLLGAMGSMAALLVLNLIVALGCFSLGALTPSEEPQVQANRPPTKASIRWPAPLIAILAFLSGFAILAAETAVLQLLLLVAPYSFNAPSAMLMVVLASLALAAIVSPTLIGKLGGAQKALMPLLLLSAVTLLLTPWLYYALASSGWQLFAAPSFSIFLLQLIAFAGLATGPLFLASGLVFPACCAAHDSGRSDTSGSGWGLLLAINGIGGFLGAELAYRYLLPILNPYGTLIAIGVFYLLPVAWIWNLGRKKRSGWRVFVTAATGIAILAIAPAAMRLPLMNPHAPFTVLHSESGRSGTLAVIEGPGLGRGILLHNQYLLGSTQNWAEQERLGSLPLLLHANPDAVAYIGLATGITPSAALRHQAVQHSVSVELSEAVYRAAGQWFSEDNRDILQAAKASVVIEDGRTFILAHSNAFDVIIGDLFLPWGPGEGRLYSLEHFRATKAALNSGGVFFQWLPMHQLTQAQFEVILETFSRVFADTELFCAGLDSAQPLIGLAGFKDRKLDWEVIANRVDAESSWITDPVLTDPSGISLLYLGTHSGPTGQGPVNTLNNMWLELNAGRRSALGASDEPYQTRGNWIALREQLLGRNTFDRLPQQLAAYPQSGSELTRLYLEGRSHRERTAGIAERARHYIPSRILYNPRADWQQWPGLPPWR